MLRNALFCLIFLLSTLGLVAQSASPGKLKKAAWQEHEVGNLRLAAQNYEAYLNHKHDDLEATYTLAGWLEEMGDYPVAAIYYQRVSETKTKKGAIGLAKFPRAQFDLGRMLQAMGRYADALSAFEKARENYREYNREVFLEEVEDHIEACLVTLQTLEEENAIVVDPLTNNYSFGFPVLERNQLLFMTAPDSFPLEDNLLARGPSSTYWASGRYDGKILTGIDTAANITTCKECQPSNMFWWKDHQTLFFTSCDTLLPDGSGLESLRNCKIYSRKRLGHRSLWSDKTELPSQINMPGYTNTHPCVVTKKDGSFRMYFSSNRPGGMGGYDIWSSHWNPSKKTWTEPENAGDRVNTYFDEVTPFYHVLTGNLFFSSDRRTGMGGMDIYRSIRGENARILSPPFNSSAHDTYYFLDEEGESGFLTSTREYPENRTPGGYRQLYHFKDRQNKVSVQINILKSTNHKILNNAVATIWGLEPETGKTILISKDTIKDRQPILLDVQQDHTYKIEVRGPGFYKRSDLLSTLGLGANLRVEKEYVLRKIPSEPINMENVYYQFGSAELSPESLPAIDSSLVSFLRKEPDIIIEVGSHTDNVGSAEDNLHLSQQRAESVINYLISKGIDPLRLHARGYGESFPIAPNTLPDGSDDPIARERNRRTEIKIMGEL